MKIIAITQRVEIDQSYKERRDSIDQKWIEFLTLMGFLPLLIPNSIDYVNQNLNFLNIDGIIFTGGNSLASYGGNAPERDQVEKILLKWAIGKQIPVLGVCRGMQVIQEYFDNKLEKINEHVAKRHKLIVFDGYLLSELIKKFDDVNSYHELGTSKVTGELNLVVKSEDGVVMAIEHKNHPIYGVMWHSEREIPFKKLDMQIFQKIFK